MDPRIREHAAIIADHSTALDVGDNVIISMPAAATDLAVALHEFCGDRGANPIYLAQDDRSMRAFLRARTKDFETPSHEQALVEESDAVILCRSSDNNTELSDIPPAVTSDYSRAQKPIRKIRLQKRWCLTAYPTQAGAQLAKMSTEEYENFVWDAINRDWEVQRSHQDQLAELLNDADIVRVVSGDHTDISMNIKGNLAINDAGEHNLPGGEVFTAPHPRSVTGTVLFDKPIYLHGREIDQAYLRFEEGRVVEFTARRNEDLLAEVLGTDDNSDRLGELGIGMNRNIDRFTYNTLFDEKMGDTVHMAIGMAYDECVGDGNEVNDSAVHVDMIVDMAKNSFIEVDGEVIQRNGSFNFEDDFR